MHTLQDLHSETIIILQLNLLVCTTFRFRIWSHSGLVAVETHPTPITKTLAGSRRINVFHFINLFFVCWFHAIKSLVLV